MNDVFQLFNKQFSGQARIAVIGGEARGILARRYGWVFPDLLPSPHLDILIEPVGEKLEVIERIFDYFGVRPMTDLCYAATLGNKRMEFVGIIRKGKLFTVELLKFPDRPDLTVERLGYYNDGSEYDESKRGYSDFSSKKLVLMHNNLFLQKYLKILSLKFQTGFDFDLNTAEQIRTFENNLRPVRVQSPLFYYNRRLLRNYSSYDQRDPFRAGIHVALMYLRARNFEEVTSYIDSHESLQNYLKRAGVAYRYFERQAKTGNF